MKYLPKPSVLRLPQHHRTPPKDVEGCATGTEPSDWTVLQDPWLLQRDHKTPDHLLQLVAFQAFVDVSCAPVLWVELGLLYAFAETADATPRLCEWHWPANKGGQLTGSKLSTVLQLAKQLHPPPLPATKTVVKEPRAQSYRTMLTELAAQSLNPSPATAPSVASPELPFLPDLMPVWDFQLMSDFTPPQPISKHPQSLKSQNGEDILSRMTVWGGKVTDQGQHVESLSVATPLPVGLLRDLRALHDW